MKSFLKNIQLIWKRSWLWLVLLFILTIFFSFTSYRDGVARDYLFLKEQIYVLEDDLAYRGKIGPYLEAYKKTYKEGEEDIFQKVDKVFQDQGMGLKEVQAYEKIYRDLAKKDGLDFDKILGDKDFFNQEPQKTQGAEVLLGYHNMVHDYLDLEGDRFYIRAPAGKGIMESGALLFFAFILAFIFFSGDHLSGYYEFSLTQPWPKTTSYWAKIGLGLLILFIGWIMNVMLSYLYLNSSQLSHLVSYQGLALAGLVQGLRLATFYAMGAMAGSLAGNFIGQGLILGMALGGPSLWLEAAYELARIGGLADKVPAPVLDEGLAHYDFFRLLYSPGLPVSEDALDPVLALGLLLAFYLLVGHWGTRGAQAERSGKMVLRPGLSLFIQVSSVLIGLGFLSPNMVWPAGRITPLKGLLMVFIFLVLVKLSQRLFKIKIAL